MKKYIIGILVSLMLCLFMMSPSLVKADLYTLVGQAYCRAGYSYPWGTYNVYCAVIPHYISVGSYRIYGHQSYGSSPFVLLSDFGGGELQEIPSLNCQAIYISTLDSEYSYSGGNGNLTAVNNIYDYNELVPENAQIPEPPLSEQLWDDFYDYYKDVFGFYPQPGSLFDILRNLALGEDEEITYITYIPTPTPTPTPTRIPVQTIYVPDGNGNTTVIYQYPDPTTGVITQSPYNPNIENNIEINCNCDGGSDYGDRTFGYDPQDPYTLTSSMIWGDGFGVEISDNPLTAANESQKTLAEAANDYSDSVNILSNSFNILPAKWITLVGLLGGILIIAGLIRTFLGG